MSTPPTAYIKSAIETLELVQQLLTHLTSGQDVNSLVNFLAQIESKANARISSSLAQTLGMDIPVADQEGKPAEYWKGVRDMARMAQKQWQALQNTTQFQQFLAKTQASLAARIAPEEAKISPLEEILQSGAQTPPVDALASPLEEILTPASPIPTPTPATPTPTPTPTTPTPTPTPATPIPTPTPTTPTPTPTPTTPTPTPTPTTPIPTPTPTTPIPTPTTQPVTPVTPQTPEPTISPPERLQALDEALKSSGIEQTTPSPSPEPAPSSLTDMLLAKDEAGVPDTEDDILSLSLREALKILRDEDEE